MSLRRIASVLWLFCLVALPLYGQAESSKPKPRVVVVGVNGMELDVIRPLLVKGEMPNLAKVIKNGAYGKLRTVDAPNCPRVYSTLFTSTKPDEHGVTGFIVGGITANTNMLKEEPIWSILSKNGVTVGMANVPATFPVMPVNGYMISGMLTRGKNCEDGVLCAPKRAMTGAIVEAITVRRVIPRIVIPRLYAHGYWDRPVPRSLVPWRVRPF